MSAHTGLTVLPDLVQGTEEWFDQRRGMVTASVVHKLIATAAPDPLSEPCSECEVAAGEPCISRSRKTPTPIKTFHDARRIAVADLPAVLHVADNEESRGLTALLAAERISGWTESTYANFDMLRGTYSEPIARDIYSRHHAKVQEAGFMRRDGDGWALGYSPDGLVGDDGLIEIKAPRAKTHVQTILADEVPPHYVAQCQAGLLVSGRKWIDFVSYVGGMPLYTRRVYPDSRWFEVLIEACIRFEKNAEVVTSDYRRRVEGLPMTERLDLDEMVI